MYLGGRRTRREREWGLNAVHCYYEPDVCFSWHIESKCRDRTMWIGRVPALGVVSDQRA